MIPFQSNTDLLYRNLTSIDYMVDKLYSCLFLQALKSPIVSVVTVARSLLLK